MADPQLSQAWFDALSIDQRADLQGSLVLVAEYGGMVDGQFGAHTYNALISWQQSIGAAPTGALSEEQMNLLGQMASKVMSDLGLTLVDDLGGHLAIMLPMDLLTIRRDRVNGTYYEDADGQFSAETFWRTSYDGTLAQLYAEASATRTDKTVSYSTLRADRYVITGIEDGRYFYEFVHADGAASAGFRFIYTERYRDIGGVASVFAASYSSPINVVEAAQQAALQSTPAVAPATPAPPPQLSAPSRPRISKSKVGSPSSGEGVHEFGNFLTFDDAPGAIAMVGEIGPSTPLDFRRALRTVTTPETLILASDGGLVSSALLVAYEVNELGLSTYILPDTGCYSACSFIFLAGKDRLAEGELGVHQVWGEQVDASSAQTVISDILEAFNDFGVRQEVTSAMLRTRPENMYVFDGAELEQWGVNTP